MLIADSADIMQSVRRCLDRQLVCEALTQSIQWPAGVRPSAVRVHRFTPRPGGNYDFEYNVSLTGTDARAIKLFARCPTLEEKADTQPCISAELTRRGVQNVLVDIAELNATVHSMDRDPAFTRFALCADGTEMAEKIAKLYAEKSSDESHRFPTERNGAPLVCDPVSFRRGRRFVLRYRESGDTASPRAWAGKCYADDRGRKQCKKHRRIQTTPAGSRP